MAKFSNSSNIKTTQAPIPSEVDPNKLLSDSLASQGLPVTTSALDYARQNAEGNLPPNTQSTGNAGQYDPYDPVNNYQPTAAGDETSWEGYQPQPIDKGTLATDVPNMHGQPRTPEEVQRANQFNIEEQARRAQAVSYDWRTPEELALAFPREIREGNRPVIVPTERGKIVNAARDLGTELHNIGTEGGTVVNGTDKSRYVQTALSSIGQAFGLDTVQTATMATTAFSLVAPILSGASDTVTGEIKDSETASYSSWGDLDSDPSAASAPPMAIEGGLEQSTIDGILGNNVIKLNNRKNLDAQGNALVNPPPALPAKVVGAMIRQALVNSGHLLEDKIDGQSVYRLSPITGQDFYQASKQMARDVVEQGRGRSQTVPVTSSGDYIGGQTNSRQGDKKKVGYSLVKAVKEAAVIAGSVPLVFNAIRTFFSAVLVNQAINEVYAGEPAPDSTNSMLGTPHPKTMVGAPVQGLESTKALVGFKSDDSVPASLAKATTMLKLSNYYGQNVAANAPRFAQFWEDYSVHRLYNDTEDANVQRDKQTRAVVGGVRMPISVSENTWHMNGMTRLTAGKIFGSIQKQVSAGNMKLTDSQREFSWLATIGKVLDIGSTVGRVTDSLVIAEQAALVTPEVLRRFGYIGSVLASIVPQSSKAISETNLDLKKLDLSQLKPEQIKVLNDFIKTSTKKNWGYRLQAYLDVNNYLNAKKNGIAFTPQATLEIDMNSAGRMFLAFDGSNDDVLERTGILWEQVVDPELQNTQPGGNPRMLFIQHAAEAGVRVAISQDQPERLAAWQSVLRDIINRKDSTASDTFGKGVLLTTDYGKPKSFHFDIARKFLNAYPNILNQLLPHYGSKSEVVADLNHIYGRTLDGVVDKLQMDTPKHMVATLQMLNRLPKAKGFWGEQVGVGSMMPKETGDYSIINDNKGNTQRINHTRNRLDPMAPARVKTVEDMEGNPSTYTPGPGTAAINQIGPIMGQYRESVLIAETMRYINGNGKKSSEMLFMQPVFDNLMLNSDSYLQTLHVANNIILPKVLEWNLVGAIIDDFAKQKHEAIQEITAKKNVDIGVNGEYSGTLLTIDREMGYINKSIAEGKRIYPAQQKFRAYMMNPANGYVPKSDTRPDNIMIPSSKMLMLAREFQVFRLEEQHNRNGTVNSVSKIKIWEDRAKHARLRMLDKVKENARQGRLYFMN